jgi:hypothetical protein
MAYKLADHMEKQQPQEWGVKHQNMIYQGDEFVTLIVDDESRNRTVAMHNATLAAIEAERKTLSVIKGQLWLSEKQLAAERERANAAELEVNERGRTIIHYKQELFAERENVKALTKQLTAEQKQTDLWKRQAAFESKHREKYRNQLAAEREKAAKWETVALSNKRIAEGLLGSKHCPTTENELGDCSVAFIHIEHYFPKGYNPDEEPWKSIKAHYNAALAAERDNVEAWRLVAKGKEGAYVKMEKQLAAEREKRKPLVNALKHLTQSNHGFKPEGCSACSDVANALAKEGK